MTINNYLDCRNIIQTQDFNREELIMLANAINYRKAHQIYILTDKRINKIRNPILRKIVSWKKHLSKSRWRE